MNHLVQKILHHKRIKSQNLKMIRYLRIHIKPTITSAYIQDQVSNNSLYVINDMKSQDINVKRILMIHNFSVYIFVQLFQIISFRIHNIKHPILFGAI